ncbi:aldo/keto reductase [Bacteroidota bacterium]
MNITEKIVLGTAQFGMDYGITNVTGKPTEKEIFNIFSLAWENGIRHFDTAPGYGSEPLLGKFIKSNGLQKEAKVLTKISSLKGLSDYRNNIRTSVETSLKYLGCPIDVLFFHNPSDSSLLKKDPAFFENLMVEYMDSTLGVSVYDPHEVEKLTGSQFELALQFPFNVLDRRFENISMAKGKRYARSIFLQGLLASKNGLKQDSPKALLALQNDYHSKLEENKLDPVQFAISFIANSKNIDHFLVGVDTVSQLRYILNLSLDNHNQIQLSDSFQFGFDTNWLDPRTWY